jgi:hypothetical protein
LASVKTVRTRERRERTGREERHCREGTGTLAAGELGREHDQWGIELEKD